MSKRFIVAAAGAAALVVGTLGVSYAQSAPTKQQQHRAVIDLAASTLGLTGDQLAQALKDARKELGVRVGLRLGNLRRDELNVAAKALGLADAGALRAELAGSTLTAVAQKHNVAPATVSNAIKADLDARIDALITAGKLKAERAAALETRAQARVDALMTHQFKARVSS
jgi:hypothetical protein